VEAYVYAGLAIDLVGWRMIERREAHMQPLSNDRPPLMIRLLDLAGRKAVVTGASRGIGRIVIEALRANGAFCYGLSNEAITSDDLESFVPLQCDLGDSAAIQTTLQRIGETTDTLDYLVNVAGIDPKYALEAGDESAWQRVIDLNLRAYYLLIRGCVPLLKRGRGRAIVNISSINYRLGVPGRAIYSASKAGILGLTTGLARELGRESIRISASTRSRLAGYSPNGKSKSISQRPRPTAI
jgi:NAD(P)-dependent dehydrogenase (short-subunit alcohol dehydrogenase family)